MEFRQRATSKVFPRITILSAAVLWLTLGAPLAWSQGVNPAAPLTLDELLQVGQERQPALAAARASLNAADSGLRGLNSVPLFARIMAKDLPIRKEQASLGIGIANAGLRQAEWETRYAVTRNFYSVQYARQQKIVIDHLVQKLTEAWKKGIELEKLGDPKIKVTQLDVDILALNLEFVKTKQAEANAGILKAAAALREALGVGLDYPLKLAKVDFPPLVEKLNKEELVASALANRGEIDQATAALRVAELEVCAQAKVCLIPFNKTFASAADIHATQIPQGVANGEYRPGAIPPEMPANLVGNCRERMARAQDFSDRARAVVDKAQNLVALEVEIVYLKWQEAAEKVNNLKNTPDSAGKIVARIQKSFNEGAATGEELLRARVMEDQAKAQLNEAMYHHALALAALERATAGIYRMPPGVAVKN